MSKKEVAPVEDSFWAKYKDFASTEIMMYLIMIIGIFVGLMILM